MSDTFLREVHLQDFRTFGTFTLPVAPGPGLTLLVGTNGLGKSSFFDGIEWCLTGRVRRFQDYVGRLKEGDYLTRRDAKPGTHRVALTFSEGTQLARAVEMGPTEEALLELLKDPAWTQINDVGAYLGFTHFLGQASQQRFTSRGQADQWQALKGPSGIDRLESVRTALRGRSTTNAFRRRAEIQQQSVETSTRLLGEWRQRAARLADLTERSAASGAESEALLEAQLSRIAQSLPPIKSTPSDLGQRLALIRNDVEAARRLVVQERAALDGLYAVVTRFADAEAFIDNDGLRRAAAEAAVAAATIHLSEAMLAASRAQQDAATQADAVARAEAEHSESVRVFGAITNFVVLDDERQMAQAEETALYAERETSRADLDGAKLVLAHAQEAQAKLAQFDSEQATLQLWSNRVTSLLALEASARGRRNAANTAKQDAESIRNNVPELEGAAADAQVEQAAAEARLAARRRDASEIAELLTGIAEHIDHNETDCPVCATAFPPGELQDRARRALASQDLQLAQEVRELDALKGRAAAARQALIRAQAAISAEVTIGGEADAHEAAAAAERASIAHALNVSPDSNLGSTIADRLAATAQVRSTHIRDAGGSADAVSAAQAHVDSLTASLASKEARLSTLIQRRTRYDTALKAIEESIANLPKPWSPEVANAAVDAQAKRLASARASHDDLGRQRAAAANAETAARERLAAVEAERARLLSAIRSAEGVRSAATAAWQEAGMADDPEMSAIETKANALNDRATLLATLSDEINAVSLRYAAWLAQSELRTLRFEMEAIGGVGAADDPVPHEQALQKALAAARVALQLTSDTRDAVVAYGEQLKTEAENFSTQFLLPLNDLIDAFNRALLSTPGETVQFNAEHTVERTALAMALRYADRIENAQYKTALPPQLVLSEGQMAANGFSILCAASTAYRWSRWRALLLDDPLQHNDIVHAAAFVDVMRNLVQLEGYQLVMSSHKRDEGEFIARKFDAAGLPCTVVELIGASKEGVRIEPPRHNAAARALLYQTESRFA